MDCILIRKEKRCDGIFSVLTNESATSMLAITLEHAYRNDDGTYSPKLPNGVYTCVRGTHQLHDGKPFITFEITNVPGHTGVLFHIGNYNEDSEGCVLVGKGYGWKDDGGKMIVDSGKAFKAFMDLQTCIDSFTLTVE